MNETEILRIDNRGRVVIPKSMRKLLNLDDNSRLMAIADPVAQEIRLVPFLSDEETILLRIVMKDVPGSLAKIAKIFADMNLNLLYGESKIIKRGEAAEWTVLSPLPESLEDLKERILKDGDAESVQFLEK
ncbi:MAG: hypothetical protein Kow0069_37630 [Promethearchaeota archaeon]